MKAYVFMNGEHVPSLTKRYTPNGSNKWMNLEMVDEIGDAEYLVIINKPPEMLHTFGFLPEKILYYKIEPDVYSFTKHYWDGASDKSHFFPSVDFPFIPLFWKMDKTWTEFKTMEFPEKTKDLCWITSNLGDGTQAPYIQILDGHKKRMDFLKRFMNKYPYDTMWELYGRGYTQNDHFTCIKGPCEKWDVLKDHRYCFCFESSWQKGYVTEKIVDAIMAGCMPIYFGCPGLEDMLPENSFVRLDLDDDNAVGKAMGIAHSDFREKHLYELKEAKRRILDLYSFMPVLWRDLSIVDGQHGENYDELYGKYEKIVLRQISEKAYKKSSETEYVDYKDKIVLDIGADYGSTAEFFLERGAKKVIAVESDDKNYKKLEEMAKNKPIFKILPLHASIDRENIEYYLSEEKPDVVKFDCEGCEKHLVGVPKEILTIPEMYIIEHHDVTDKFLKNYMSSNGFDIVGVLEWAGTNDIGLFEKTKLEIIFYERSM